MISDMIRIRGAARLPETTLAALIGKPVHWFVESRFLRSKHAKGACIDELMGEDKEGNLYVRLDRPIGSPVLMTVKRELQDPIALIPTRTRIEYESPLEHRL